MVTPDLPDASADAIGLADAGAQLLDTRDARRFETARLGRLGSGSTPAFDA
jgi:hypothetical protein